ncbi:MAG: undecaprenyl-diphosphate phosphatase [Rikenellaceae bacterium]
MTYIDSIILGAIQGLTEFLPVSSSGHLEIANAILGISEDDSLLFAVALHGGTVLSTLVVFRKQILKLLKGLFRFEMNDETKFVLKILVSMIPVLIVGFTLKDKVEALFSGSLMIVGFMLLLTALLLWFSSVYKPKQRDLSYKDSFIIGLSQAVAVLPGLSRSGTTISTGLMLGVKREEVAPFSFLMVLIPILGANFLELLDGGFSDATVDASLILVGFLTSFITGTLACRMMIKVVAKGNLKWFALYCLLVGMTIIVVTAAK